MNPNKNQKLIVIGGPTASGKSSLAINLAKQIDGIIINADSVQIYKEMNIGSGKDSLSNPQIHNYKGNTLESYDVEKSGVLGFMFDLVFPNQSFSLYEYQTKTRIVIDYIHNIGKTPILVGGTGLYIDSVIRDYQLSAVHMSYELRNRLNQLSIEELKAKIPVQHLEQLNNSDLNNPRRLIRLIEKINSNQTEDRTKLFMNKFIDHQFFYISNDRETLNQRIDERVENMFSNGILEEVKFLMKKYPSIPSPLLSCGYKQIISQMQLGKDINSEETKHIVKIAHKQYAKRQITWFEGVKRGYSLVKVRDAKNVLEYLVN